MHTDPISDLLIRVKNAMKARHSTVTMPHSKIKENIAKIMEENGFIVKAEKVSNEKFPEIKITLKENKELSVKRISKPGQRIYIGKEEIKKIKSGLGISILSTSKGVMTGKEARKLNIGGELLCEIY